MEEEIAQQPQTQPTKTTTTTTSEGGKQEAVTCGGDGSMGGNRSGSPSSTVGWMGEGGSSSSAFKTPTTPRQPSKRDSGYHTDCSPATFSTQSHFTFEAPESLLPSSEQEFPQQQGSPQALSFPAGSLLVSKPPRTLSPGWQPRRLLPDVDSDDEGDDDAFVSDNVNVCSPLSSQVPFASSMKHGAFDATLRGPSSSTFDDDDDDDVKEDKADERRTALRLRPGQSRGQRRDSTGSSPKIVTFRPVRHVFDDSDDDTFEEGVANTDYHRAPLSMVSLPGGERIQPLMARTIATQTPHFHCQLIDQILACPQDFPQYARGSAVRRLRYYSEGEESVSVSSLTLGPLPDIVPVTHGHRERSLSAPDLEALQRQRTAAREVGRELRRISDEFVRRHEEMRGNPQGALATIHAELNGVAAFFLTGVRRFLYRGFAGYFRHVFLWTRQAMASAEQLQDSSVDDQR